MEVVVTGRHCELTDRYRSHVEEKLARLEKHDHRIIRVDVEVEQRTQPASARPRRPRGAHGVLQGSGDPRRGRAPRTRWPRSTWRWTRWPRRCGAPRTGGGCTTAGTPRSRSGRRWPTGTRPPRPSRVDDEVPDRQVGPITVDRRRSAGRAREDPPRQPDDARPGALRDGAGRARLLPVRRQGERAALGRLPPSRLRLRRDLARRDLSRSSPAVTPSGVPGSGYRPVGPSDARRADAPFVHDRTAHPGVS